MFKKRMLILPAVAALFAVLAFLVWKTRGVDYEAHGELIATLRQLKQIDAEWNVDVLRSKTGFNNNYDPVASPLPLIAALETAVREKTEALSGSRDADMGQLTPLLEDFKVTMDKKIALIEGFKSQNAILRNSSRYLPLGGAELAEAIDRSVADPRVRAETRQAIEALVADAMNYLVHTDPAVRTRVEEGSASFAAAASRLPAELGTQIQTFLPHIATALRQQAASAELLAQLAAVPTAKQLDGLMDAYNLQHAETVAWQQRYTQALIAYTALLVVLIAYQGWRLFMSYRQLSLSNRTLRKTNQELKDEAQLMMVQAEKMSALGRMVAGIAHEINTPLAYVKGTIDVVQEQMTHFDALAEGSLTFTKMLGQAQRDNAALSTQYGRLRRLAMDAVDKGLVKELATLLKDGAQGIAQISEIVLNLKNFSRVDRARVSEVDVREGLESTLLIARHLLKDRVRVVKQFGDLPRISCSPSQINQVFLNILTNAVQAIPADRSGEIILRTTRDDKDAVRIEIQDNGSGIPKDVLPKIFDPFFTTKEIGQGSGMGLAISYKIIEQHGGKLLVDTEEGVGTMFSILLPIAAPESSSFESDEPEMALAA